MRQDGLLADPGLPADQATLVPDTLRTVISANTAIEWIESTWSPLAGCTKISPGRPERMARRLQAMGQPNSANGFRLTLHEHALAAPPDWKKPQMIFVNSMSDLGGTEQGHRQKFNFSEKVELLAPLNF